MQRRWCPPACARGHRPRGVSTPTARARLIASYGDHRLTDTTQLAHRIASLAAEKLATDIVILDMRDVVSYTDHFVICSGRNPRQAQAIADQIARGAEARPADGRGGSRGTVRATGSCSTTSTWSCTSSRPRRARSTGSRRSGARCRARRTRPGRDRWSRSGGSPSRRRSGCSTRSCAQLAERMVGGAGQEPRPRGALAQARDRDRLERRATWSGPRCASSRPRSRRRTPSCSEIVAGFTAEGVQVKDMDRGPDRLPGRGRRPGRAAVLARGRGADRVLALARGRLRRPEAARVSAGPHLNAALAAEADAYRALLAGDDARPALVRARDAYLASHAETGPRSWGRLLGALKMAILAGDGAERDRPAARSPRRGRRTTPASAYVRALAQVTLGERPDVATMLAAGESFARTGRALAALGAGDRVGVRRGARRDRGRLRGPRPAPLRRRDRRHRARAGAAGRAARDGRAPVRAAGAGGRAGVYSGPIWGYSSAGRAPRWQRGGHRFEPD